MKKYGKFLMFAVVTFFATTLVAFAKEKVTLTELLEEVDKYDSSARDVYIVGDYAFTTNHTLKSEDVMLASRSIQVVDKTGRTDADPVFQEMVVQHLTRTKGSGGFSPWSIVQPKVGNEDKKFADLNQEVSVHYINYNLVNDITADVEDQLQKDKEQLNSEAADYGFNSISYENHTLTFDINDLNRLLKDYKDSGIIAMFKDIVSGDYGFEYIEYTVNGESVKKYPRDLTDDDTVAALALEVLQSLVGESEKVDLTYLDVAGKSTTATVYYKDEYGTHSVEYTLHFVYNVETKDNDLEKAASELAKLVKDKGIKSVTYSKENRTAIFDIGDLSAQLKSFKDDVLPLFQKYVVGATSAVFHVNGQEDINIEEIDPEQGASYALQLLSLMVGEDVSNTNDLTLEKVAGKVATADVTYTINGEEIPVTYTVKFVYSVETKDEDLEKAAHDLENLVKDKGIKSVTYSKENRTAIFDIGDLSAQLKSFKDDVLPLFQKYVVGATSAVFHVNGQEDINIEEIDPEQGASYALQLLSLMVGEDVSNTNDLTLEKVAGKVATADVTYTINGEEIPVTYTVKFVYSVETKDEDLEKAAGELENLVKSKGIKSVTYSKEDHTVTFAVENKDALLKDFKDDVIPLFQKYVVGATSAVFHVDGKEDINIKEIDPEQGVSYALQLLSLMVGEDVSNTNDLTLEKVIGQIATADVTYTIDGKATPVTYTVKFIG